jgi:transposase
MTIVAHQYTHVVGIDTHAATHTYALIHTPTGELTHTNTFPTTPAGITRAITWINRHTTRGHVLASVECTGSYGANLTRALNNAGINVVEAKPPTKTTRSPHGKSDPIDAETAARSILGAHTHTLPHPRTIHPHYPELQCLLAEHDYLTRHKTAAINTLTAIVRGNDLGIDARRTLTTTQIDHIAHLRPGHNTILAIAHRRAQQIHDLTTQLTHNHTQLAHILTTIAPGFMDIKGIGPITGARILAAYTTPGRIPTEAAFARLAGTAPIPASSGNTQRHRLSRRGDRKLNAAIHTIALVRQATDPETRNYITKRTTQGKTPREARRCLKRHITRQLHRQLTHILLDNQP